MFLKINQLNNKNNGFHLNFIILIYDNYQISNFNILYVRFLNLNN